jgi:hypothetical protein
MYRYPNSGKRAHHEQIRATTDKRLAKDLYDGWVGSMGRFKPLLSDLHASRVGWSKLIGAFGAIWSAGPITCALSADQRDELDQPPTQPHQRVSEGVL